ncbi:FAD-dependent monooxygenase [Streptomyces flaveolus]|uniref:FAD-dependent monooxygenase n=1 Tax=Streptomyces flaveolus TaxID=67297 RepID=UPI0037F9C338
MTDLVGRVTVPTIGLNDRSKTLRTTGKEAAVPQDFDADVAAIGYGPTGVVGALTLAQQGARVIAFERDKEIYSRARAVTVNDWTVRIFQNLGIGERIEKIIDAQRALRWVTYDGHEVMRIEHPPSTLGTRARFYNIYQPTLETELRACSQDRGDLVSVRYGAEVTEIEQDDSGVTVTTTDTATGEVRRYRTRYVIEHGRRNRPRPPEWIVELGSGARKPPLQVQPATAT